MSAPGWRIKGKSLAAAPSLITINGGRMLIRFTFLLLLLISLHTEVFSQTVTGTVRDAGTREPLPGANVTQSGTTAGTTTGTDGRFTFTLSEAGRAELTVTYLGYSTRTVPLSGIRDQEISIVLVPVAVQRDEVLIRSHRVDESEPLTYTNVTREQIERNNLGQDIPWLLQNTPSVVSTSDAGAGVGYTGIRIRGVDPTRINVTVNGIPLNDSESHGVFWVNMPDFATSVDNIQIQRGVGASTNGPAAFGASLNLQTTTLNPEAYGTFTNSYGSFNTRRHNMQVGTGLLGNSWAFDGRLSMIKSDGYIDRAFSDLTSWYLSGARYGERSLLKVNVFSGTEQTYQAWNGVPEHILSENRTFNEFTYENQTDNYSQHHYQVHYSQELLPEWTANASLHYTRGEGYYEEFRANDRLNTYGIGPVVVGGETISRSDLVRRRWLDNHFYGVVFNSEYRPSDRFRLTMGGGYNEYDGDHFGEVIWARFAGESEIGDRYYDNNGFKTDFNSYARLSYHITPRLIGFGDLQVRRITYTFLGIGENPAAPSNPDAPRLIDMEQTDRLTFLNPKAGLVYRLNDEHRLYASISIGNKEPTRRDYTRATPGNRPQHETLYNVEAGYRADFGRYYLGLNYYLMQYDNQLILTGEINDVGAYIRTNVPDSYRTGIEAEGGVMLTDWLQWSGNATLSRNKIQEYTAFLDNYDVAEFRQDAVIHRDVDIAFSPSFIGASVLRLARRGFSAELQSKYVSRQFLDNTQTRLRSLDPYLVNDVLVGYSFGGLTHVRDIRLSLQVNNVLNSLYESNGYTFGYIAGGDAQYFNYYYPQAGRHYMLQLVVGF
jgi:iron complex outermembrane recepter protein